MAHERPLPEQAAALQKSPLDELRVLEEQLDRDAQLADLRQLEADLPTPETDEERREKVRAKAADLPGKPPLVPITPSEPGETRVERAATAAGRVGEAAVKGFERIVTEITKEGYVFRLEITKRLFVLTLGDCRYCGL